MVTLWFCSVGLISEDHVPVVTELLVICGSLFRTLSCLVIETHVIVVLPRPVFLNSDLGGGSS